VTTILEEVRSIGRPADRVEAVKDEIEAIQQRMLESL